MDDDVIIYYDEKIKETSLAVLYTIGGEQVWIPKSVHDDFDDGSLAVQKWWAEKEGIH